jgi:putative RecB family exonuclease
MAFQKWTGPSISPSRAKDYKQCPLMYKFKVIDKLPSPPSIDAVRGTHIHLILEHIFDQPAALRTLQTALDMIEPKWDQLLSDPKNTIYRDISEIAAILNEQPAGPLKQEYTESVRTRLENYFKLEDPSRLEPTAREKWVQTFLPYTPYSNELADGAQADKAAPAKIRLGGFIDRLEINPAAGARIADYKTGASPKQQYEDDALFQMYFYSLVYAKEHGGELPKCVRLIYLKDAALLEREPTQEVLDELERDLLELWVKIEASTANDDWPAQQGPLCGWCNFKDRCPKFAA